MFISQAHRHMIDRRRSRGGRQPEEEEEEEELEDNTVTEQETRGAMSAEATARTPRAPKPSAQPHRILRRLT